LKYLTKETLPALFALPADLGPVEVEINRLDNQSLVRYHDVDWKHWD
jgi:spermidine synthase